MAIEFTVDRMDLLVVLNKLKVVNSSFGADVSLISHEGKLALFTHHEGTVAVEIMRTDIDELEATVDLEKLYEFVHVSPDNTVRVRVTERQLAISDSSGTGRLSKKIVVLDIQLPTEKEFIAEIRYGLFDDLVRVANISDGKDTARPMLGGVLMTIDSGDIRFLAANGVAFGYSWYRNDDVVIAEREMVLVKADSLSAAHKYDWHSETLLVYRPAPKDGRKTSKIVFTNGTTTYLFLSELAEKERFPAEFIYDAAEDSNGNCHFTVDSEMFKSYVRAAIKMSEFDDRSVSAMLVNGNLIISSGKMTKEEVEEGGQEFLGFSKTLATIKTGHDFTFAIDSKLINQVVTLLEQVDKGLVTVTRGEETHLIYFKTPAVDALYGVAPIMR